MIYGNPSFSSTMFDIKSGLFVAIGLATIAFGVFAILAIGEKILNWLDRITR